MSVQKALVMDGNHASVLTDRPIPQLRSGYILVKVKAVAVNPTDWKSLTRTNVAGATMGCDFAGVVEQIGQGYSKPWRVGDRIAGMAFGANYLHHDDGAFAEHILVRADMALRIPDNMTFEAAATLGVGSNTCGQGLFSRQGLRLAGRPNNPIKTGEQIFIYGGSTATAAMGIQLAKLAGYTIFTVCSPEHFDFVKSLGASQVFDYKDPASIEQIKAAATDGGFKYVWDTITLPSSVEYCMKLILPGGRYRNFGPLPVPRNDIDKAWTLAYTVFGEPVEKKPVLVKLDTSEDFEDGKQFVAEFEKLLLNEQIRIHPFTVSTDGLDGVLDGLKLLMENKISRQKLVYTL